MIFLLERKTFLNISFCFFFHVYGDVYKHQDLVSEVAQSKALMLIPYNNKKRH